MGRVMRVPLLVRLERGRQSMNAPAFSTVSGIFGIRYINGYLISQDILQLFLGRCNSGRKEQGVEDFLFLRTRQSPVYCHDGIEV